jgi:sterol 24-C-methyltransferase
MSRNPVIDYYNSSESHFGYRILKGVKHFGFYPEGKDSLPMHEAQMLMNEQLATKLALPTNSYVLDAGCGEGNVAMYLADKHHLRVSGIDLLQFNVNNAKKKQHDDNVNFQVGSYMQLPYPDATFDAVYTMETLVHAPDYRKALKEFYRVLKPNGRLVLFEYTIKPERDVTPAEQEGMRRIKQVNEVAAMPAFNEFTFGSMASKLKDAGFSNATTTDITPRMLPMLKKFYTIALPIYNVFRLLHLENHLINGMSAVEFYKNQSLWKYEISTANKK